MQVHPSSRGWSVWPEWLSLLDSAVLSFPSTPAHADVFDLMATSFSRVQMQPTKLPVLNSLCKMWCFFPLGWAWTCTRSCWLWQAVPSPGTACGLCGVREGFLPRKAEVAHCFNHQHVVALREGQNMPRPLQKANHFLRRKQSLQLASGAQRSCGSLENTRFWGNYALIQACLG